MELKNKVCALIPFFNEEKYLRETVLAVLKYVDFILAVNDGSTDNSAMLIRDLPNVEIISHKENQGKGAALRTGFRKALERGCALLFTLDADMQHDPARIPVFLEKINETGADIVIGNRLRELKGMPLQRRASNFLTSKLLSWKTGTDIKDSQSGYRLLKCDKLETLLPDFAGFEAESEILVKAARNKLKTAYVDIPTIYNDNESKMKSLSAIIGFIKVLFI